MQKKLFLEWEKIKLSYKKKLHSHLARFSSHFAEYIKISTSNVVWDTEESLSYLWRRMSRRRSYWCKNFLFIMPRKSVRMCLLMVVFSAKRQFYIWFLAALKEIWANFSIPWKSVSPKNPITSLIWNFRKNVCFISNQAILPNIRSLTWAALVPNSFKTEKLVSQDIMV